MTENKWADKIRALLDKAESTASEHESSALMAKAQELMLKFAISEAELAQRDPNRKTRPIVKNIDFGKNTTGIKALRILLAGIADINRCKVWMNSGRRILSIAGFEEDVEFVEMLYRSIEFQMGMAVITELPRAKSLGVNAATFKTNFMYGYVGRVISRLREAQRVAVQHETTLSSSTALVLVDRKAQVDAFVTETVGKLGSGPKARNRANGAAWAAGAAAGDRADVSGGRGQVGGRRTALPPGR